MHRTTTSVRRFLAYAHSFVLLCAAAAPTIAAQDKSAAAAAATPQESARAAYSRGVEAYSAENFTLAHEQFSLAERTFPSPNIELMLGRTLAKLERWLEARTVLQRAQAGSTAPKYANTATLAGAELATVEKQLARVELEISREHGDEKLSINGNAIEPAAWGAPIVLDPGNVRIELSRPGVAPTVKQLMLAPGTSERVALKLEPKPEPARDEVASDRTLPTPLVTETPQRPVEPPPNFTEPRSPWLRGLSYALAGVGVAGFVGFAAFGAYSHGHYTKLEELCPGDGPCHPSYRWLATRGQTYQTLANASLVAGSVLLAAGVTLWIVSLSPGRAEVAVTSSGVRLEGRF